MDGAAAAAGLEEGEGVVPAEGISGAGLIAEVDQVGAAAEDDVLGVDGLFEGGVLVGVGAASDEGTALEQGDFGARRWRVLWQRRGRLRLRPRR